MPFSQRTRSLPVTRIQSGPIERGHCGSDEHGGQLSCGIRAGCWMAADWSVTAISEVARNCVHC